MKKRKIYHGLWLAVLGCSLMACQDFLSHEPDDRQQINTVEKARQTVIGAYNNFGFRFTDMSTDNVGVVTGYASTEVILEDLYMWKRHFSDPEHQDAPGSYWYHAYQGIAQANIALDALTNMQISAEDEPLAEAVKAEALVVRSYYHFMLVNLFAPHYQTAVSRTTAGIPYVKTVENKLINHYERNTVEEVYTLAEEDLKEAIRLMELDKTLFSTNKYRFTVPTVYLYASRFYQWRNRDEEDVRASLDYAEKSIAAFGGVSVMRYWSEYALDNKGPVDITQAEVGMVQSCATWTAITSCYQMTMAIKNRYFTNPFDLTDERLKITYQYPGNMFMPAFYYVPDADGMSTATDLFPLSEAVLNAAEACARLGLLEEGLMYVREIGKRVYEDGKGIGRGYTDLCTIEKLPGAMGLLGNDQEARQKALIEYILFERRVHFLLHGMRWFDIRRYELEVEHKLLNGEELMLTDYVPNRDYEIPTFAIEAGITPNDK